jgi:hypothetical protein
LEFSLFGNHAFVFYSVQGSQCHLSPPKAARVEDKVGALRFPEHISS